VYVFIFSPKRLDSRFHLVVQYHIIHCTHNDIVEEGPPQSF